MYNLFLVEIVVDSVLLTADPYWKPRPGTEVTIIIFLSAGWCIPAYTYTPRILSCEDPCGYIFSWGSDLTLFKNGYQVSFVSFVSFEDVIILIIPWGHPQEASLGHHVLFFTSRCEVRVYTGFPKNRFYFGGGNFQMPTSKYFFWGGNLVYALTWQCLVKTQSGHPKDAPWGRP